MPATTKAPTSEELTALLGGAAPVWTGALKAIEERCEPLDLQWRPSKSEFGRICLVQHKKRTLIYITPQRGEIMVSVVLGERAYELALSSSLPEHIKQLFRAARPYAEGRGIRFPAKSGRDVSLIAKLVEIKLAPK